MTYRDVLAMRANLDQVNFIPGADARFVYAVAKNKALLDTIVKVMDKMVEPSGAIVKFREESDGINKRYAERDPDGTVAYITLNSHGSSIRTYRRIIGDGNPESEHGKNMAELKQRYKDDLTVYDENMKTYRALLDKELPAEEYHRHMIDMELVPAGLHPLGMSGCLEFIKV